MKVKIPKNRLTEEKVTVYNKPKKVYIPLISGNDINITILVNKGEYVYKGSIVGKRKGNFRIPICSSVSGTVIGFEDRTCFNGEKVKCVAIENDFKEKIEIKSSVKKSINKYNKEEFLEKLRENGIIGMGGAGFPTYVKYESKKNNTLIVNAAECEPFVTADEKIALSKCEEILEAIDAIIEINNMKEAIIAIEKDNIALKNLFDNYVGTYLKIKVVQVPNFYSVGWERTLVKEITGKEYDKLPSEKGIIVNNISTIYAIYEALKYNKPLIERIITFSGDLDHPRDILVKIGTPVKEVIEELGVRGNVIIAGGPMMGVKVLDDLVISANQNCVLNLNYSFTKESPCINCGRCVSVCPAKLSPVLIMKNNKPYLDCSKCIDCGLCSYVCPAKINVREYVRKAKRGDE